MTETPRLRVRKYRITPLGLILGIIIGFASGFITAWYFKPTPIHGMVHIRFTLDWAYQGPQAPFLLAYYKGFFAEEGLSVTIDRGYGSAKVVSDVAAGVFDIGFGDTNTLIEFIARNPGAKVRLVAIIHVKAPLSVVTLRDTGIKSPRDLEGKRLGAPAGDAARRIFPAFAEVVGIDPEKITWVTMDIPLREPMLARRDVDAVTGFFYTVVINLLALNISETDIVVFKYADYMPLVGNGIIVNTDFLERHPDAVRRFIRAVIRGIKYTIQNPDEAINYLLIRDPTLNRDIEKKRLMMALEIINVPEIVSRHGFGYVEPDVIERNIDAVVRAFKLERRPSLNEVVDFRYLPSLEERLP